MVRPTRGGEGEKYYQLITSCYLFRILLLMAVRGVLKHRLRGLGGDLGELDVLKQDFQDYRIFRIGRLCGCAEGAGPAKRAQGLAMRRAAAEGGSTETPEGREGMSDSEPVA
jgi:hypothetical protein